jgi:threonine synthase
MSYMSGLVCLACGGRIDAMPFRYFCPDCGGYLDVAYDYDRMAATLSPTDFARRSGAILSQWLEFLPIERPELIDRVTLGERPTPMIPAQRLPEAARGQDVWLKNDAMLPTCSLKDRSLPLTVVKALELGRQAVGIVSSGNASASLAAYAARAGLQCIVFLKQNVSASKLFKTMVHRPLAIQVRSSYSAAEVLFQQARDEFGFFDCDGLVNPYRIEGKKTFAYEVARDLGWRAPAAVLMPTGYGNGVVAAWKGFQELKRLGFIDSLPAMVAVQPAVCAPIARAFRLNLPAVEAVPAAESIADAVCANDPVVGGQRVMQAVRESDGVVLAVDEDEIVEAVQVLASREGLAMEATGAIALAGLLRLNREGNPWADGTVILSITGHGLNAPEAVGALVPVPAVVDAEYGAVQQALAQTVVFTSQVS